MKKTIEIEVSGALDFPTAFGFDVAGKQVSLVLHGVTLEGLQASVGASSQRQRGSSQDEVKLRLIASSASVAEAAQPSPLAEADPVQSRPVLALPPSLSLVMGEPVSFTPTATNALTWMLAGTLLPPGLAISADGRTLSGTPTETGSFLLNVIATNDYGETSADLLVVVATE